MPRPAYRFKNFNEDELRVEIDEATKSFERLSSGRSGIITAHAIAAAATIRIRDLAERVDALEAQLANFQHRGAFQAGVAYFKGNFVQHSGGCWLAMADTDSRPGESSDWRLVAKRGRDGRR